MHGRHSGARQFTRVFDALASEPGIQYQWDCLLFWIPGSRLRRAPE